MKKICLTKKIRVIPVGDQNERDRVYQYYRDAQYNQYLALNQLMSEVGVLYYHCKRDIKSDEFRQNYKEIFKRNSIAFDNINFPKGGHLQGTTSRRVQADFTIALKNGFAKGDRSLPIYRRTFPYMIHNAELHFYKTQEIGEDNVERDIYCIKTVNKMHLKVILGKGKKDYKLISLLENLAENNPDYKIGQSSIYFDKNNKMMMNLTITKQVADDYTPVPGRVMGVAYGYSYPIQVAFNDMEKTYTLGDPETFVEKRKELQAHYTRIQTDLKYSQGGRGKKHKLRALTQFHGRERNFAKTYNHTLSKQILDIAQENKVEMIVIENIDAKKLPPIMLRNWTYYELTQDITYKADIIGIKTVSGSVEQKCSECGEPLEENIPEEVIWTQPLKFQCPHCKKTVEYGENRAKLLSTEPQM